MKSSKEDEIAALELVSSVEETPIETNEAVELPEVEELSINEDYETGYNEQLNQLNGDDTYEVVNQKASIHQQWANTLSKDIEDKKREILNGKRKGKRRISFTNSPIREFQE